MFKPRKIHKVTVCFNWLPICTYRIGKSVNEAKLTVHKTCCLVACSPAANGLTAGSFVSISIICASVYLPRTTILLYCSLESSTRVCDTPVLSLLSPSPFCNIMFMKSSTSPPSSCQQSPLQNINTRQWRSSRKVTAAVRLLNGHGDKSSL